MRPIDGGKDPLPITSRLHSNIRNHKSVKKMQRICFRRPFIFKIISGEKTQTRRLSGRYQVGEILQVNNTEIWILITKKYRQRLGEISMQEIRKEGFSSPKEFQDAWKKIHGCWNPSMEVWTYEFEVISPLYCMEAIKRCRSQE